MILFHGVPLSCINQSALYYHVPAALIISIMQIENGRNGMAIANKNGSFDLGIMQINTRWLQQLKKYRITKESLQYNGCLNVQVGAWILAKHIVQAAGWQSVGHYHSFTPKFNHPYSEKLKARFSSTIKMLKEENA